MTKPNFPQAPTANRLSPVLDPVLDAIRPLLDRQERVLVAIDGRCGAGKTTLAARLQAELPCRVFHMDDFFLQPYQRTPERLQAPGGNVDHERFLQEVLLPAARGEAVVYRPYLCAREVLGPAVSVPPARLTIVEGSYACHQTPVALLSPAHLPHGGTPGAAAPHRGAQRPGKAPAVYRPLDPPGRAVFPSLFSGGAVRFFPGSMNPPIKSCRIFPFIFSRFLCILHNFFPLFLA